MRVVAAIAAFAFTIAPMETETPFHLEPLTRQALSSAYGTSCFKSLAIEGARLKFLFSAPMPRGYHAITHGLYWWQHPPFTLVTASPRECFVGVRTHATVDYAAVGYEAPSRWLPTVESVVQPLLGRDYTAYPLHNGVVYTARGKPTLELVLAQVGLPSESMTERSYDLFVLIFQNGATALALYEPCEWWLPWTTFWTTKTYKGVCDRRWVRWTPAFHGG